MKMVFRLPMFLSIVLSGGIFLSSTALAGGSHNSLGSWESSDYGDVAPLPEPREGYCMAFSSAEVDGEERDRIYVGQGRIVETVDGFVVDTYDTNTLHAYDIETDTWVYLAGAPQSRAEGVGVGHGGLLYCIGGRYADDVFGEVKASVYVYNPTTDSWSTKSPLNTARAGLAGAAVGNKIYTFGGRGGYDPDFEEGFGIYGPCSGEAHNVAEVYDIATDTWSNITPPPIPVTDAAAIQKRGHIYVIGGCASQGFSNVLDIVQIYDPVTDSWTEGTPMPTPRASLAVGILGNTIYAIGGVGVDGENLDIVEGYKISKNKWSGPLAPKPHPSSEVFTASRDGKLYIPGSGFGGIPDKVFHDVFSKKSKDCKKHHKCKHDSKCKKHKHQKHHEHKHQKHH